MPISIKAAGEGEEEVSPTMARLFAVRHEGTFDVIEGEGVAFRVWLPLTSAGPGALAPPITDDSVPPREASLPAPEARTVCPGDPSDPAQAA